MFGGMLAVALAVAGCSSGTRSSAGDTTPSSTTSGTASTPGSGGASGSDAAPFNATLPFGQFTLADRIASKVKDKKTLDVTISFQTVAQVGAPALMAAGMKSAAAEVKQKYGVDLNTRVIGPSQTDPTQQISQIEQAVGSGQVDCLGVQPVTPDAFANVIDSAVTKGIPTFTVNTDSNGSHRFAYYGPNDTDLSAENQLGVIAGQTTVDWAKANSKTIKKAALVSGDTTAPWAQGRMEGWLKTVKAAFPDMQVVGTPTNALTTGYDAAKTYGDVGAFMNGHPDVDFYFDSDWGGEAIGKLIADRGLKGKVAAIGYNLDGNYLEQVRDGNIIATIDQAFDRQAAAFVTGCADFLLGGKVPAAQMQYVPPTVVTQANVASVADAFKSMGGE
jgi:ABC-type sugar transport system substrate-binding protein